MALSNRSDGNRSATQQRSVSRRIGGVSLMRHVGRGKAWRRGGVGLAITGLAASLCVTLTLPAAAAPAGFDKPKLEVTKPVKVTDHQPVKAASLTKKQQADVDRARGAGREKVTWPAAKAAALSEPATSASGDHSDAAGGERASDTASADLGPVDVSAGPEWTDLKTEVVGHAESVKAGVDGVVVRLAPTMSQRQVAQELVAPDAKASKKSSKPTPVQVRLDYTSIDAAHGADWSGRVSPRLYPECVLTTPEKQACQDFTALSADRDTKNRSITADVPQTSLTESGLVLFAATSASATGTGDFGATPLAASSSWSVGGGSGGFSWSHPFTLTAPAAGSAPSLAVEYSSQTVDGMTSTTNNQSSVLGEGFDLSQAFIERSYLVCDTDGRDNKADMCWKSDNATLAMAGAGGELVKAGDGTWKLTNDDGTRIRRIATAADSTNTRVENNATLAAANPDNNNEYWEVTRPDGTRLYFGRSRVPGQTEPTNSVWTTPVYGNNEGEPCYDVSSGSESFCAKQAWRWNLDYVVDTSGNGTAYRYAEDINHYRRNNTTPTEYTRGGRLIQVDYGLRNGADGGTTNDTPPYRVAIDYATRCLAATGCETYTKSNWPDTPYDQLCAAGAECTGKVSPTYFTRHRLNTVTAQARVGGAYTPVDAWAFDYTWVNPDNQQESVLWLSKITRTGKAGDGVDITLPPTTFTWSNHDNRVNTASDGISPLTRYRLQGITTETGAHTSVFYSDVNCTPGDLPAAAESNTRRCYPVKWTPEGVTQERTDWFHKYVVTQVDQIDRTGDGDAITTFYDYEGGAAWAYNNSRLVPEKYRTWSQWRGYETVRTTTGDPDITDTPTQSVATYFRGMDGDRANADGGTKNVTVADSTGASHADNSHLAGIALETKTLTGAGGALHTSTINQPWFHVTAGSGLNSAALTGTATTLTKQASSAGGYRTRQIDYTHDTTTGVITRASDLGDVALSTDQTCTATEYVGTRTVDAAWMVGFASRQVTSKGACGASALNPSEANTISHTRTRYDGGAQGQAPTKGLPTETDRVKSFNTTPAPVFQITATSTFDEYGRQISVKVPAGNGATSTDTTVYTHTADGTLASIAQTQDSTGKAFKTTTFYTPERSMAVKITDPNSKNTSAAYDALGRTVSLWKTNRSASATPSVKYSYKISPTEPIAVTTSTLNRLGDGYRVSTEIYDSLLRPRQTQTASPGGRLITGVLYDALGNADRSYDRLFTTGAPTDTMADVLLGTASHSVKTSFDSLARPTKVTEYSHTDELWSTNLTYAGVDKATVDPPQGAPSTTGYTDIRGQQIKHIEHGSTDARDLTTTYDYDLAGRMTGMDSPAGDFTWGYDLRGRKTSQTDPEAGTTRFTYTENDLLASTTDARGKATSTVYDQLNRSTHLYDGTTADATKLLTSWTYDTPMKGLPSSTSRYVGGQNGAKLTHTIAGYNTAYNVSSENFTITGAATGDETLTSLDNGLPASLVHQVQYNVDQSVSIDYVPGVTVGTTSVLAQEAVDYTYDGLGNPVTMGGSNWIVQDIDYDGWNQPSVIHLGQGPAQSLYLSNSYQEATGRLTRTLATTSLSETVVSDHHYTYDPAGNPTKDHDRANGDAQCYSYDDHQRLAAAWTPADANCDTDPATALLGGPSPYRQSWTYTNSGLRKTQTSHLPAVGTTTPASEVTDTYTYPAAGSAHANFPTAVTRTNTATGAVIETNPYGVDDAGNTIARPGTAAGTTQDLTWNSEGDLASLTVKGDGPDKATTYVYGADGTLLVKDSPSEKSLMVFGLEITVDKTASPWVTSAARHYDTPVGQVAVRHSDGSLDFQIPDAHGTAQTSLDAAGLTATRRYLTPYGEDRAAITGASPDEETDAWPTSRGFLNMQVDDDTGLNSVGARQYDASIGRFISVDPLLDTDDASQALGYVYANNNPLTWSDPTGLAPSCTLDAGGSAGSCGYDGTQVTWYDSDDDGDYHNTPGTAGRDTDPDGAKGTKGGTKNVAGEQSGPTREELEAAEEAQATLNRSIGEVALKVGWEVLKDFIGYNDLVSCLDKDYKACVGLVLGSIPWGKAFKAGKALYKIGKAAAEFIGQQKAASKLLATMRSKYGAGTSCKFNSFTGDTPVLIADGSEKPIKDVKLGDVVMAANPVTGVQGPRKVVDLIRHSGPHTLVNIRLADGMTIEATSQHPFWVQSRQTWIDAIDLEPGDVLVGADGDKNLVFATLASEQNLTAYNLTVEGLHTYFAGTDPVLVHNDGGPDPLPTQVKGRNQKLTNKQATQLAKYLGYRKTSDMSHGQLIFTNGKTYISQDIGDGDGSHNGGTWKIAKNKKAILSKEGRTATTDALLNEIGC